MSESYSFRCVVCFGFFSSVLHPAVMYWQPVIQPKFRLFDEVVVLCLVLLFFLHDTLIFTK